MNWFIPALVRRSPDSGGGINDELGTRLWPRSSKNDRNSSRIRRPSIVRSVPTGLVRLSGGGRLVGAGSTGRVVELRAQLALPFLHGPLAFLDRLRDELGQVHQAAPRFPSERRRLDLARLAPGPSRRDDGAGRSGAQPERDPEAPAHVRAPSRPAPPRTASTA